MPGHVSVISYVPSTPMEAALLWGRRNSNRINFVDDVVTKYTAHLFVES